MRYLKQYLIHLTSPSLLRRFAIATTLSSLLLVVGLPIVIGQVNNRAPASLPYIVQTRPGAIPTTLTDVIRQDAYICASDFTGSTQTLLVQDRQPTPVPFISGTFSTQSTWLYSANDDARCRWMPGGVSWQAGASGVTGAVKIKCLMGPCTLVSSQ